MIDPKLLRTDPDLVRRSQEARGDSVELVDELVSADEARRSGIATHDRLRAEQKELGRLIPKAQGDDWNKLRAAHTLAGGSIDEIARAMMTSFLVQYQATMTMLQDAEVEDLPPSKRVQLLASLADAFTKTVAANKRVLPETSQLATALELLQFLMVFVQEKHPKHLAAFVEVLEPFGVEVERKFG